MIIIDAVPATSVLSRFCLVAFVVAVADLSTLQGDDVTKISRAEKDEHGCLVHTVESTLQSGPTKIRVLLPDQLSANHRCPTLYVLPVEANDESRYGNGLLTCKKANLHNEFGLVCVAPTFADLPWYADHAADTRIQQETCFLRVVLPFVEKTYPVVAERTGRLLVGFSKSGWGAFSLILRHPDIFEKAAAWDAPLMKQRPDQFGMGPIFGSQENFQRYQISRLLRTSSHRFQSEPRLFHLGYGNFRDHHQQFEQRLLVLNIAHRYQDGPDRSHTWHSGWLPEAVGMLVDTQNVAPERLPVRPLPARPTGETT